MTYPYAIRRRTIERIAKPSDYSLALNLIAMEHNSRRRNERRKKIHSVPIPKNEKYYN